VEAEARRPDTTEGELTSCTKKRKTTAVAKIVDSRISVSKSKAANDGVAPRRCNEGRRFLEAGAGTKATEDQKTECAKKRKAMPVAKIVESRIPASNDATTPRRCNEGRRFLEVEGRPESTGDQKTECAKKRKTMPVAKIVESSIPASKNKAANDCTTTRRCNEGRRFLEAEARPKYNGDHKTECAKTMPPTPSEIVEPRMAKRETASLVRCVASLSAKTPTTHVAKEAAANAPVSFPSTCQLEEGEIIEEEDDAFVDICGGVSPVPTVHRPSQILLEDDKTEDVNVLVDTRGEASIVAEEKNLAGEAGNSPISSSSGSSSSDTSDSDSGDSDSDDEESVRSSPAPTVPDKIDASIVVAVHNVLHSPPCLREDGGTEEGASPVAAEEYVATGNGPRNTSSLPRSADDKSVGSSPAPFFLPERDEEPVEVEREEAAAQSVAPAPAPPAMSDLIAEARAKMRRNPARQKAYDDLEAMERNAPPSAWIRPVGMTKLGITAVEYAVTSGRLVPGRGGPLQQWFRLSWRGE
jgi:hypothetical protein